MPFDKITTEPSQAPTKNIWVFKFLLLSVYLIENVIHDEAESAQYRKIRNAVGRRIRSIYDV